MVQGLLKKTSGRKPRRYNISGLIKVTMNNMMLAIIKKPTGPRVKPDGLLYDILYAIAPLARMPEQTEPTIHSLT